MFSSLLAWPLENPPPQQESLHLMQNYFVFGDCHIATNWFRWGCPESGRIPTFSVYCTVAPAENLVQLLL